MRKIINLIQEILPFECLVVKQDNKNGNANMNNNEIANTINKNTNIFISDRNQLEEIYEPIVNRNSSVNLKEVVFPIEALINQGKFPLAIKKYEELIDSPQFNQYSKDERFLIYIGLLNCNINSNASDEVINHWKSKIQSIGTEIKEIHRFYFLLGIREYNNRNFEKALIYINQALDAKPDYMNAVVTEILIAVSQKDLSYDEAKIKLDELLNRKWLGVKDISVIQSSYGDIAFNSKDYMTAQYHYSKSNELSQSLVKEVGIAACQYFASFKEIKEDGTIAIDKIDFDCLKISENMFAKIYESRTEDTIQTIVRMCFAFYFSILALNNDHKTILNIYNETAECFDKSMAEPLRHIVEAQVIYGIFDKYILSLFGEYEQIKYEAFYHEKQENYDSVIELLTPVFEGKYKDEKVFQLTYLTALKETNQFERYMHYYQKFSSHEDEFMRMNYIRFLMKRDEKELVIAEIKKFKLIAKNGFVLYDLLLIYLEYQLVDELDEFFNKVDIGKYIIIGLQKPFVFYQKMMHLLNQKRFDEYFKLYETCDVSFLKDSYRLILKINYYIFKRDLDNLASSYYEYFQYTQNHNELIKAVQTRLQINQYHEAEFYLEQVNPMLLDTPEYYYMFKAIILREKKQVEEAFKQLEFALESLDIDLESHFHQFYTAFNMNNNRTEVAFRYMGEYYAKNPNPYWFKVIQCSENESGSQIIAKLEAAIGARRDLTAINQFFNNGVIGISTYNMIVGTGIEEILFFKQYPFTRVSITKCNILESESKIEIIGEKIIIDATTLTILSATNALNILEVFNEIILPYSTVEILTERKTGMFKEYTVKALEYVGQSPVIKRLAVDEVMKIKGTASEIISEDILDCISLSQSLGIPFLNTEVVVGVEFKLNGIIDVNALFFYMKEKHPEKRGIVAGAIAKIRALGMEFISFDAEDMYIIFKEKGAEGIEPFLRMGKNADYKTFPPVFVTFLARVYNNHSAEEFEECSKKIISFMDKYVGKTRYYMSELIRKFPNVEDSFTKLIQKPSVKNIIFRESIYHVRLNNARDFMNITETPEFNKLTSISSAFIIFVFQFISIFNDDEKTRSKYIGFLKQSLNINDDEDIQYILQFMKRFEQEQKDG